MKVYWAASLHSEAVREWNQYYATKLEHAGIEVLLPQRHGIWELMVQAEMEKDNSLSYEEAVSRVKEECYQCDMRDLAACDVCIIYCPIVPSEGAIFEAAYCFADDKPVYIFCPNDDVYKEINLMLTRSFIRIKHIEEVYEQLCERILVLFSGGLDSTVLLAYLKKQGYLPEAIIFDYGQKHKVEIEHAKRIAEKYGVPYDIINITDAFKYTASTLIQAGDTPEASYAEGGASEVPGRNMVFISIAQSIAISRGISTITIGVHKDISGEESVYTDCTSTFVNKIRKVLSLEGIHLYTPFVSITKRDIVRLGGELGVDFDKTYSCYAGGAAPCGKCATCIERQQAMEVLNESK